MLPEALKETELRRAEQALRRLCTEAGQELGAWNTLGNLLQERFSRYKEAEEAYRRAIIP